MHQPPDHGNLFLVTHGRVLSDITIRDKQIINGYSCSGLAAVFDPSNKANPLLGCLSPADWIKLGEVTEAAPNKQIQPPQKDAPLI